MDIFDFHWICNGFWESIRTSAPDIESRFRIRRPSGTSTAMEAMAPRKKTSD